MRWWLRFLSIPLMMLVLGFTWEVLVQQDKVWREDTSKQNTDGVARVKWADCEQRVKSGEWLLVDARDKERFQTQHFPAAISLPSHAYPEVLTFFVKSHGTDKTLVIMGDPEDPSRGIELAQRLMNEAGCGDVRIVEND